MLLTLASLLAGSCFAVLAESEGEAQQEAPVEVVSVPDEPDQAPQEEPASEPAVIISSEVPAPEPEVTPEPQSTVDSAAVESDVDSGPESEAESIPEGREAVILFTGNIRGNAAHFGQLAAYRALLMEEGDEILVVDTGNAYGGNKAVVSLMNAVPYDLAVPGANEFAEGNAFLQQLSDTAGFRYISCNYTQISTGGLVFAPFATGRLGDRRVSFVALSLPSSLPDEESSEYGFRETELSAAVGNAVTSARSEGAGAVILLISMTDAQTETARQIVSSVSGVNAVIISTSEAGTSRRWTDSSGLEIPVCSAGNDLSLIGRLTLEEDGTLTPDLIDANSVNTEGSESVRSAYAYAQGLVYEYQSQFEADTFDVGSDGIGELQNTDEASAEEVPSEDGSAAADTFSANAREKGYKSGEPLNTETDPEDAVDAAAIPEETLAENGAAAGEDKAESPAADLSDVQSAESLAEDLSESESVEDPAEDLSESESVEDSAENLSGPEADVHSTENVSEGKAALAGTENGSSDESSDPGSTTPSESPTPTPTPTPTPSPSASSDSLNTESGDNGTEAGGGLNTTSTDNTATETGGGLNTTSNDGGLNTTSGNTLNTASGLDTTSSQAAGIYGAESSVGAGTGDERPIALYIILAAAALAAVLAVLIIRKKK